MKDWRFELRKCNQIRRLWRVLWATAAQRSAIDAVLGHEVAVPPARPGAQVGGGFDEVARRLSLALDALLNAIDAYRERKNGGAS